MCTKEMGSKEGNLHKLVLNVANVLYITLDKIENKNVCLGKCVQKYTQMLAQNY